jgi:hypothetical protein
MTAERILITAISMQREGLLPSDIEHALMDLARREEPGCHWQRNFGGHVELHFADGQCLRFDGRSWALTPSHQLAPLYATALAGFDRDHDDHRSTRGA